MSKAINFTAIYAIVLRHLFNWKKDLDRVVDAFWWATIDIIFWGLTSLYIQQSQALTADLVGLFVGGIIFWTVVQNAQREINMPLLDEAWNRNLINVFTTPIRLREFVIATICLGLFKLTITLIFLSIVAFIFYQFNLFRYGWYLLPAFFNLILVGWWIGFIVDGLILRYGYRIQAFAWAFIFIIYPFSAVIYPVSILPMWAKVIASILPTSYIFENMRSILFTGQFSLVSIVIALSLNIMYLSLSLVFLKASFKHALKHARLVRLN